MITLTCQLMQREYKVKKVCKISEMPQNAKYFNTIYFDKQCQQIYRTDSGILYARTQSLLELGYQNSLTEGCKVSQIMPFLKIIAQQQKLNLTKLSHYRKAKRILLISINQN